MKKHKNDVFRLFPLVSPAAQITVTLAVRGDVAQFIKAVKTAPVDLKRLGIEGPSLEEVLKAIENLFAAPNQ